MNWHNCFNEFDREVLYDLGYTSTYNISTTNPIVDALKTNPQFVADGEVRFGRAFNRKSLVRLASICQAIVHDRVGGPEQDDKPKSMRRHWYAWYKVGLAQPMSVQYGDDLQSDGWGPLWFGRLSQAYGALVDVERATYKDLWVEDGSRMMQRFDTELYPMSNLVVCVEKDSLFPDFVEASQAIGAKCLLSGKGKNSKAAVELMLRKYFNWPNWYDWEKEEYIEPFSADNPLILLVVSDFDYDGEEVIQHTFAKQCARYTDHIVEVRIGVNPNQVKEKGYDLQEVMYQVKIKNARYIEWCEEKALFVRHCDTCDTTYLMTGAREAWCNNCGTKISQLVVTKKSEAWGFEVEAMRVSDYKSLMVDALLRALDFDSIVQQLREHTHADEWQATYDVQQTILDDNEDYQRLLEEFERLEEIKRAFENKIERQLLPLARSHNADFSDLGDDPEQAELYDHVRNGWSAWRPFDVGQRTEALVELMQEEYESIIDEFKEESIEF